jgi:hypothetical protein
MRNVLFMLLVVGSLATAQIEDESKTASTDSVNVRAMVKKQIEDARAKKTNVYANKPVEEARVTLPVVKNISVQESPNSTMTILMNQPVQYKIFGVLSLVIIGFVLIRRTIMNFGKSSKRNLKVKIGLMREEKVGGAKANPKMMKIRKVLKDNLDIFKQNDQQLAKTARQLNVSQGELLLAARLKFFEMKKM